MKYKKEEEKIACIMESSPSHSFLPSQHLTLQCTMSYEDRADVDAQAYFTKCEQNDTILANYWISNEWITYTFFRKEGDSFIKYKCECSTDDLPSFTFYVGYSDIQKEESLPK